MVSRVIQVVFLMLLSVAAKADGLVAELANDSARVLYSTQLWGQEAGPLEIEMGFLFNEDDNYLYNLGVMVRNDNLDSPVIISIGGRGYAAKAGHSSGDVDIVALALGGDVLLVPDTLGGLGLGFHFFGAPSVVTGGDAEGLMEYGARLDYQVTPQANVYWGYQKIIADIENTSEDATINSGFQIGVGIRF